MNLTVRHDEAEHRFLLVDSDENHLGEIDYRLSGDVIDLYHTEIDPRHEGHGYGSILVKETLHQIDEIGGLKVRPSCPFIAKYLDRHPEEAHRV